MQGHVKVRAPLLAVLSKRSNLGGWHTLGHSLHSIMANDTLLHKTCSGGRGRRTYEAASSSHSVASCTLLLTLRFSSGSRRKATIPHSNPTIVRHESMSALRSYIRNSFVAQAPYFCQTLFRNRRPRRDKDETSVPSLPCIFCQT